MNLSNDYDHRESETGTIVTGTETAGDSGTIPTESEPAPRKREKVRRSTSHLKAVPETLPGRERLKTEAERYARTLDKTQPFSKTTVASFYRNSASPKNISVSPW